MGEGDCGLLGTNNYAGTLVRGIYKVFDLVGHFILAIQGLLGRCTFVVQIMS